MNERKKDRDILDELLREKQEPRIPGMDDLDKLTHRRLAPDRGAAPETPSAPSGAPPEPQAPPEREDGQSPEQASDDQDIPFLFVTAPPQAPERAKAEAPAQTPPRAAPAQQAQQAQSAKAAKATQNAGPEKQRPAKAKSRRKPKRSAKKKTTHYLSKETFEELSQAKRAIRKLVPKDIKTGVSKSLIVDSALKLLLEDFEAKGEESALLRQVLDAKDKS